MCALPVCLVADTARSGVQFALRFLSRALGIRGLVVPRAIVGPIGHTLVLGRRAPTDLRHIEEIPTFQVGASLFRP